MSRSASFQRKIAYIAAIALLLLPLAALSQPATVGPRGTSPGGKLAQLRTEHNLAQAELGEINPASEAMKLSSLGLRGVAVNILTGRANHYKKIEDWDKLEVTVNQIIRLQPNYLKVWDFQAHNLSYNVSVEFDDYRMRYQWVKKGIEFLILGTHYNRDEPGLLNQIGWFTGQKMGRADEEKQFRRMFKDDKDFHELYRRNGVEVDDGRGQDDKPDNWLVAKLWYERAVDAVASGGRPIRGRAPLLFYNGAPMAQINGADAMQKDGFFFEAAQAAWRKGAEMWESYGNRELPTSFGFNIRLNDKESLEEQVARAYAEIDRLAPGVRDKLRQEKIAVLEPELRAAVAKDAQDRNPDEEALAFQAEYRTRFPAREILPHVPREARPRARQLVEQIMQDEGTIHAINVDRGIVNFEYWRTRCEAERSDQAQQAHRDVYYANRLFSEGEQLEEARRLYEKAWQAFGEIYDTYPILMDNAESADTIKSVERYRSLLGQLDLPFPRDFPLTRLLEHHYEGEQLLERIKLIEGTGAGGTSPPATGPPAADPAPTTDDAPETGAPAATDVPATDDTPSADTRAPAAPAAADAPTATDTPAADAPAVDTPPADTPPDPQAEEPQAD
jgi:hypothetical protein